MTIVLPKTLERYFQASNAYDKDSLKTCFKPKSQLFDEGQAYHEVEEIVKHLIKTNQDNLVETTVLEFIDQGSEKIVKARIEGIFSGNPLDLNFYFTMSDNKIMTLKIL